MKRTLRWLAAIAAGLFLTAIVQAQTYIWTGIGNGWKNQLTPPNNGTANLYYGTALYNDVPLLGNFDVNSLTVAADDTFYIKPLSGQPVPMTITVHNGLSFVSNPNLGPGELDFGADINIAAAGAQTFNIGYNNLVLRGHLTGSSPITLRASEHPTFGNAGFFIFNNTGSGNSGFSGNITLDFASAASGVAFWNTNPFGTGAVTFVGGGQLVAHGTQTITNNFTLNTSDSAEPLTLRSWDAPLTLSGTITLAHNVTLNPMLNPKFVEFSDGTGSLATPGAYGRNPTVFTGAIGESGGARSLTISGQGLVILKPTAANTYTGGTIINSGSLVFGNNNALPATGSVTINNSGYAGFADLSTGNFFAQANAHVNKTSSGSIGVDTLPGNSTATFSEAINLSATGTDALALTNATARIGTGTAAILTGAITPQGTNYQFGNGGGSLYVQTSLGDVAGNGTSATRAVTLNSGSNVPLKLFLQGTNTYTGGTTANGGYVIFDGANALPATGSLTAGGTITNPGNGYIGYTDATGLTPSSFLAKFVQASTWGIIGFDTHAGNATTTIGNVDLTGFNNGVYLGTATSAILNGTLGISTGINGSNPANTLRLTAANGGVLTVNSTLVDGGSPLAVTIGTPITVNPAPSTNPTFGNGIVILNGSNTYSGNTNLNASSQGITLEVGNNSALGTSSLVVTAPNGGTSALQAGANGINLINHIVFFNGFSSLHLTGNHDLTLSGAITGTGLIQVQRALSDPLGNVTLAGNNSGFSGGIQLQHSTLTLAHNYAAGNAEITMFDASSSVVFAGAATAPVIYGMSGIAGSSLVLPNGTNLTFDISDTDLEQEFNGVISAGGGAPTSASLVITASNSALEDPFYLSGNNQYTGGTTVTNYGVLALGHNHAAGSGAVTLNGSAGGLLLNSGVTFTNHLVYNAGGLGGYGTFAPANLTTITFGANKLVAPGLPGNGTVSTGKLTFNTNVGFADGGKYFWSLQDATSSEGASQIITTGNLDLTSISTAGFTIVLQSLNADSSLGLVSLTPQAHYTFAIALAGSVAGFDPTDFAFDISDFQGGSMPLWTFNVSADATHLYLNFQAIPEPSTWALLVGGAGLLGLAARRRRGSRGR